MGGETEQSRSLGELLARCLVDKLPAIATVVRQVHRRDGKVYVDYLQNGSGKLIVAPFSVRPLPGDAADDFVLASDGAMSGGYAGDPVAAAAALQRTGDSIIAPQQR